VKFIPLSLALAAALLSQLNVSPRVVREMNAVQQELLRRDPSARAYDGYDAANVDEGSARLARSMSNAQLQQAFATYVRMTGARPGAAKAQTVEPASSPQPERSTTDVVAAAPPAQAKPAPSTPAQSKPASKHEAYCKPFWSQARTDCFLRDRESFSCPIIATNKYEQCLKTGRWY
jgi:hypothetical protein